MHINRNKEKNFQNESFRNNQFLTDKTHSSPDFKYPLLVLEVMRSYFILILNIITNPKLDKDSVPKAVFKLRSLTRLRTKSKSSKWLIKTVSSLTKNSRRKCSIGQFGFKKRRKFIGKHNEKNRNFQKFSKKFQNFEHWLSFYCK